MWRICHRRGALYNPIFRLKTICHISRGSFRKTTHWNVTYCFQSKQRAVKNSLAAANTPKFSYSKSNGPLKKHFSELFDFPRKLTSQICRKFDFFIGPSFCVKNLQGTSPQSNPNIATKSHIWEGRFLEKFRFLEKRVSRNGQKIDFSEGHNFLC